MNKGRLISNLKDEFYLHADYTESYYKRLRSAHKDILENKENDYLLFAYVTLCSSTLEYSLNHLIVSYFLDEFGPFEYKRFVDGFIKVSFANKLISTPILISKGKFYFDQEHTTIKSLEELISIRNRIVHKKDFLQKVKAELHNGKVEVGMTIEYDDKNYINQISKAQCIRFGEALGKFKSDLLIPFEKQELKETDLLKEKK